MITVNNYLNFNGNCMEAFEYYKSIFGGEFSYLSKYKDMPQDPEHPLPAEMMDLILHVSLPISKETSLMGSDVSELFTPRVGFDGNIELMISADTKEEIDALWEKFQEGSTITMPLGVAFWGDYFGALTDKFGTKWMLICSNEG